MEVYGRQKRGVAYNHQGQRVGRPHVAAWAEAEIVLAADLGDGTDDPRATAPDLLRLIASVRAVIMDLLHFVKNAYIGTNATAQELFQCQLLSDGAIPVNPAALKEAVTHHALTQKKKDDCQNEYKQELSSSERGWLSFWRSRIHRIKPPSQSRPTLRSGDWESDLCIKSHRKHRRAVPSSEDVFENTRDGVAERRATVLRGVVLLGEPSQCGSLPSEITRISC